MIQSTNGVRRGVSCGLLRPSKCSFGSKARHTRRKKIQQSLVPSKKEKLRFAESRLVKSTESTAAAATENPTESQGVVDLVESQLVQIRQSLYQLMGGATSTEAGSKNARPERRGPTMDGRWWMWNIALALLPATLIGLYCEFVAEPERKEFFANQEKKLQERILGEVRDEERVQIPTLPNLPKREAPEAEDKELSDADTGEISIAALKRRIELLELQAQQNNTRRSEQQTKYQIERMNQSGVQNRIEDRMAEGWNAKKAQKESTDAPIDQTTLTEKVADAMRTKLNDNLQAKIDAAKEYAASLKDHVKEAMKTNSESIPAPRPVDSGGDSSNDQAVQAVEQAASASQRAADTIQASLVSSEPDAVAKAAIKASFAAKEAAEAAEKAAAAAGAATSDNAKTPNANILQKTWNRLFSQQTPSSESDLESESKRSEP